MAGQRSTLLEERFEGFDPWFYELDTGETRISRITARANDGSRMVVLTEVNGQPAYRKFDEESRGKPIPAGAREKASADLAQIINAYVPATLVWRVGERSGCVQQEPRYFKQSLRLFLSAFENSSHPDPEILGEIAKAYDPANVFLDVWVGNIDRGENTGNTLVAENTTTLQLWITDFDLCLGHDQRPWDDSHKDRHGFDEAMLPAPRLIANHPAFLEKIDSAAEDLHQRLATLDETVVEEICRRAYGFYCDELFGTRIASLLFARRIHVKDWSWELLHPSK